MPIMTNTRTLVSRNQREGWYAGWAWLIRTKTREVSLKAHVNFLKSSSRKGI